MFFLNGQGKPSAEGPCFVVVVLFCSFSVLNLSFFAFVVVVF